MVSIDADFLIEKLRAKKLTVATAESCTGGLLSAALTEAAGASEVYCGGVISYCNELKNKLLNVENATLTNFGAVSRETALEMAHGARLIANSDLGVGITGIAGPAGGSAQKPVGLVYIAVDSAESQRVEECRFNGNRAQIRGAAVTCAMEMLGCMTDRINK